MINRGFFFWGGGVVRSLERLLSAPWMTHLSVFFSTTLVQDGLLLFSSASFLEMKAAALALLLWLVLPDPPPTPDALGFSSTKPLPTFTVTITGWPALACWAVPLSPPAFLAPAMVASTSLLGSDWKKWILDWSVFAAVVEVRGAGVGLAAVSAEEEAVPTVVREVVGWERAETGREGSGDGAGKAPGELGGALALTFSHDGPGPEEAAALLVSLGSRPGGARGAFGGKSLRGGHLSARASDLSSQSELVSDHFDLSKGRFNDSEKHLTWHSSGGRASRPPGVAAPGGPACCRRRTCCSTSPSDGLSRPEPPGKREVPPSSGSKRRRAREAHPKVSRRSPVWRFWGVSVKAAGGRCWRRREGCVLWQVWSRESPRTPPAAGSSSLTAALRGRRRDV